MLWLERQVVETLAGNVDPAHRVAIDGYVDGVLRAMPELLRLGVAGESVVLGTGVWLGRRLGSRRSFTDRIESWEHSRIGPIRQYVRLLSSLVIFGREELIPDGPEDADTVVAAPGVSRSS
ncbi:MAG: hypothetical protein ACXVKA_13515 [Acidimicrobiia bacterium]